ncbi:MAG: hypothetical protein WHZ52_03730 [Armatimonadota bacterium]
MKRLLTAMVAVALATVLAGQAGAQRQVPYSDPAWAPQWFKDCQGYKLWVEWTRDTQNPNNPQHQLLWSVTEPFSWPPRAELSDSGLTMVIPNVNDPTNYKQIWFQIKLSQPVRQILPGLRLDWGQEYDNTRHPPEPQNPTGEQWLPQIANNPGPGNLGYLYDPYDPVGDPFTVEAYWEIDQQPQWERLFLNLLGTRVDKVRVVTQCTPRVIANVIPEPVFFQMGALLGLSGLGMLKLRRR